MWTIVLAAGRAERFGGDKPFVVLGGRRLVDRVVETASEATDAVVVVLPAGRAWDGGTVAAAVTGGATRAASVRAGLAAVPGDAEVVVIHDAAHPLASVALFAAVVGAVRDGAAAAVPVLPVAETPKRVAGGLVVETLDREGLVLAQTPQAFRAAVLRAVHAGEPDAVEDSLLVEALGEPVVAAPGDPVNVHVATQADLDLARRLL